MLPKIILITIFVSVRFRNSAEIPEVIQCSTDMEWKQAVTDSPKGIVPILITKNEDSNVDNDIKNYFDPDIHTRIKHIIQVNIETGRCGKTVRILCAEEPYPKVYLMKNNYIVRGDEGPVTGYDENKLGDYLEFAQSRNARKPYGSMDLSTDISWWVEEAPEEPQRAPERHTLRSNLTAEQKKVWGTMLGLSVESKDNITLSLELPYESSTSELEPQSGGTASILGPQSRGTASKLGVQSSGIRKKSSSHAAGTSKRPAPKG